MRTLGQTQRQPGDRAHEALLINAENYHYFEHTQAVRSHLINGIYKFSSLSYAAYDSATREEGWNRIALIIREVIVIIFYGV
jgi:hypothetical protein